MQFPSWSWNLFNLFNLGRILEGSWSLPSDLCFLYLEMAYDLEMAYVPQGVLYGSTLGIQDAGASDSRLPE